MNLFSKNKEKEEEKNNKPAEEQKINENIEIYVMPEKYRREHVKVNQAKITGIIILSVGVVVLFVMAIAMYYFLFADSSEEEADIIEQSTKTEENLSSETDTQQEVLNTDNNKDDDKLSGVQDDLDKEDTATSSQEELVSQEDDLFTSAVSGIDSDGDMLTDNEEQLLGTDLSSIDSDNDGYGDLEELKNLYNPAGAGKLIENLNIREMESVDYHYTVFYPAEWTKKASSNDESIIFMSADNQFIQIIVQPNYSGQTINDWYREQFSLAEIDTEFFVIGSNWVGLKSLDGLTIYLSDQEQENILALTYNIGSSSTLEYKNIFDMMVNSFKFID